MSHSECLVYLLHNKLSDCVYIGKSMCGLKRPREHGRLSYMTKNPTFPTVMWIAKYRQLGIDYEITILEHCSREDLSNAESFYIGYFRYVGARLLNLTEGGDGGALSEQTKQKISFAHMGRKKTREAVEKSAAAHRGKQRSLESKQKQRAWWTPENRLQASITKSQDLANRERLAFFSRQPRSQQFKNKIAEANKKRICKPETRLKLKMKRCSSETRSRMSVAQQQRFAKTPVSDTSKQRMSASQRQRFSDPVLKHRYFHNIRKGKFPRIRINLLSEVVT